MKLCHLQGRDMLAAVGCNVFQVACVLVMACLPHRSCLPQYIVIAIYCSLCRSLFPVGISGSDELPADLPFKVMVAVNKCDLLPKSATARRVEQWVWTRLKQSGLPRPTRVFMVSAVNNFGVQEMLGAIRDEMGFRADLWVVGAQNSKQTYTVGLAAAAAAILVAGLFVLIRSTLQ